MNLGGVNVSLRNKALVDLAFLDEIFSNSGLNSHKRELLLILDTKDGFECEKNKWSGVTLPSSDVFMDSESFRSGYDPDKNITHYRDIDLYYRPYIDLKDLLRKDEWDAVVYIPRRTTKKWKYKPYFAFVLGHELEHAKVIRENLKFHMCATWLFRYNCNIFGEAGINCKSKRRWNFPLELHCNKKGKKLATSLFDKEEFDKCLETLREDKNDTPEYKENLAFIMDELEGEPYTDSIWQSICCDIQAYYNNILKKAAHKIWRKQKSNGIEGAEQFDLEEFLPLD